MQLGLAGIDPPSDGRIRNIFFTLIPDESVIASIEMAIDSIDKCNAAMGNKIKAHRQHMTMLYIDTFEIFPENVVRNAISAADSIRSVAFDLTLDKAGSFPSGDIPWWLGSDEIPSNLTALHQQLVNGLQAQRQKFRSGAAFAPHVSISRKNEGVLSPISIAPIHWRVREFCLIESIASERDFNIIKKWTLADE